MEKELILVDEKDNVVGYGEKLKIHQQGRLHRAFSIFVLNQNNELMLQRRALSKYHSGGLWANTCCSHPLRGEILEEAIHSRLLHEMGFDCELYKLFHFIYHVELDNGLIEYELDNVYLGFYEGMPKLHPDEVAEWKWMNIDELKHDLAKNPDSYVYWLKEAFEQFQQAVQNRIQS